MCTIAVANQCKPPPPGTELARRSYPVCTLLTALRSSTYLSTPPVRCSPETHIRGNLDGLNVRTGADSPSWHVNDVNIDDVDLLQDQFRVADALIDQGLIGLVQFGLFGGIAGELFALFVQLQDQL